MNKQEFLDLIKKEFLNIDIEYIEKKIDKYIIVLDNFNKKFNLTRLNKEETIFQEYFYNSIIPYKNIDFTNIKKILDIGSGSGIPGFVIKIFFPHIELHIVESNSKKCLFLNELKNKLLLDCVFINNERAEKYAHKNIESFDLITCRAVAELKVILELGFPMAKINGLLVFPKSLNYLTELDNAKYIMSKLDAKNYRIETITINDKTLNTFIFLKEKKVNSIYPRNWKEIIQ